MTASGTLRLQPAHRRKHDETNPAHRVRRRARVRRDGLVSLGVWIFDNLDFDGVTEIARELGRYEFLFTAAPLRIEKGMGSPLNPIATF